MRRLADGTVKQVNPFTGTQVWTVPGRAHRPLEHCGDTVAGVTPGAPEAFCAFCETRLAETTPERSRVVRTADGSWQTLDEVPADELTATRAEFRVFGNLFEIVSMQYWAANHGYRLTERAAAHQRAYLATETGREHVRALVAVRLAAAHQATGSPSDPSDPVAAHTMTTAELAAHSESFFGGCHDVVVARRHLAEGAETTGHPASSGTLTPDEHAEFLACTVRAAGLLADENPYARHVAVFQNWLKPAGASFDHLHKQIVAIDEVPATLRRELDAVAADPELYERDGLGLARVEGLVVARNDHAVAVAGVGHRYPALVVYSTAAAGTPGEHSPDELRGVSDVLHACHAATGPLVPVNEEWHHRPVDVGSDSGSGTGTGTGMPWRIVLKWRISTPAGFEGATEIYVNTVDPWTVRERTVRRLRELRAAGAVVADLQVGDECTFDDGPVLRYPRG